MPYIPKNTLPSIDALDVAKTLDCAPEELEYWAWPQTFGSTAGPFPGGGVGGMMMTNFTIEAWHDGGGNAVLFCDGRIIRITKEFEPRMYV